MKYHFYSSVSLSILVGTTREDQCPKCRLWNDETSLKPRLIGSLSPSIRGGGPCFFCGPSLIPVSLLFLRFILLAQTKTTFPTNEAAAFQGQASGCWGKETTGEEHGSCEEWEQRKACSFTHPKVSVSPQLSVPYLQKTLFRDSPNEHSCPHSAPQWSPPLPLSLFTMENIAPIKPQRQWAGVGKGVEVCV